MPKRLQILFFSLFTFISVCGQGLPPVTEVRAVWLATHFGLDWPDKNKSIESQKKDLTNMLDVIKEANFNTVFFQTRLRGDASYKSKIEPLNKNLKSSKTFDPLQFVIEECHNRGLECHAWFITYPLGTKKHVENHGANSVVKKYPDMCIFYDDEWRLDPGHPKTKEYLLSLVDEIVSGYDIDGISFDYIRYSEAKPGFPDQKTHAKYGKGKSLQEWRRQNINSFVRDAYKLVKSKKNWVQVSSSTIGVYQKIAKVKGFPLTAYNDVFQDVAHWMREGIHDAIYPMMYYKNELFDPYLLEWSKICQRRLVVPVLGIYKMLPNEKHPDNGNWSTDLFYSQIKKTRQHNIKGQGFFRTKFMVDNTKGFLSGIKRNYYKNPAKLPPLTWLNSTPPAPPRNLTIVKAGKNRIKLQWQHSSKGDNKPSFNIYSSTSKNINLSNSSHLTAIGVRENEIILETKGGMYFTVTASDRYRNESSNSSVVYLPN
ncbi:glycoside hydrolase family 10 protein [Dysgonomonas sp. 520]|uniref:glycoside hydrolase family 10 protein n=1 Tax=Dysgonomonas sp. 520 TaxID=2302931 RepID=UPI0013D4AAD9|nr:family 10 glycosylhydrolase [Dysgonomonas sp. 520]NDW08109.1 S-layer protein [Dysgonomonas sp. 520]